MSYSNIFRTEMYRISGSIQFRPDIRPLFTICFWFLTVKKPDNFTYTSEYNTAKNRVVCLLLCAQDSNRDIASSKMKPVMPPTQQSGCTVP